MKINDLKPGTKVTITRFREGRDKDIMGDGVRTFSTKISEVKEDGTVTFDAPIEKGRIITFAPEVKYEFLFSSDRGFFLAVGQIVKNYRLDTLYMMDVMLISPLERYQRREYYRIECSLNISILYLTDDVSELEEYDNIDDYLLDNYDEDRMVGHGTIANISGGGALFYSSLDLDEDDCVLLAVRFDEDDPYEPDTNLVCRILERNIGMDFDNIAYRVEFVFSNAKFREKIIKFVFDEERRIRKKVQV
ncbi:MAG: flagellar brake protein [Lachnospiraceae bacterium]|nr:flagellar brake protein [Lachnospiraceae bacterium]